MNIQHEIDAGNETVSARHHDGFAAPTRHRMARRLQWSGVAVAIVAGLTLTGYSPNAVAANPTFSIVAPSEWDLPIAPSANVIMQTGIFQQNGSAYDQSGNRADIPGTHTIAGITRFAHLFSFDAMPNVGFFWEVLVPELNVSGHGNSVSGLGDPLFDFAFYTKPVKGLTIGMQNIVSIPVGNNELSNHYWEYLPSLIVDYNVGPWEADGTFGAGFASDRNSGGTTTSIGNTYYGQGSLSYHINDRVQPFVNYNYQVNRSSHNQTTNELAPGSAPVFSCIDAGGCHESDAGIGVKVNFSANMWLSTWYSAGVSGSNTVRTNALYLRFVDIL